MTVDANRVSDERLEFSTLREANEARQRDWCPDQLPDLSFRGNELAGEVGEVCNVIKKLERERLGWRGSRDSVEHLAEELGDVVICASLIAIAAGIDLDAATEAKFNATSEKVGLPHRLRRSPSLSGGEVEVVAWIATETPDGVPDVTLRPDTAEAWRADGFIVTPLVTFSSHQSVIAAKDAEIERVTRERDDFQSGYIKALDKIEAAEARAKAAVEALTPFAARCDEAVRSDDSDNDGVTVKTKHLRAARAFLSTLNGAKP